MKTKNKTSILQAFTTVLCAAVMVFTFTCLRFVVTSGPSMEPTFDANDALLCMRRFSDLKVGDIVLIQKEGTLMVKRVSFVAGEEVKIVSDGIIELYGYWGSSVVPEGFIFVTGDNPDDSYDSRDSDFGLVNIEEEVWGTVIWHMSR